MSLNTTIVFSFFCLYTDIKNDFDPFVFGQRCRTSSSVPDRETILTDRYQVFSALPRITVTCFAILNFYKTKQNHN